MMLPEPDGTFYMIPADVCWRLRDDPTAIGRLAELARHLHLGELKSVSAYARLWGMHRRKVRRLVAIMLSFREANQALVRAKRARKVRRRGQRQPAELDAVGGNRPRPASGPPQRREKPSESGPVQLPLATSGPPGAGVPYKAHGGGPPPAQRAGGPAPSLEALAPDVRAQVVAGQERLEARRRALP